VTADHQENSPQLSKAKAFKSEMQVKDFKRTNTNVKKIQTSQCTVKF
jgi:hypothetical protein